MFQEIHRGRLGETVGNNPRHHGVILEKYLWSFSSVLSLVKPFCGSQPVTRLPLAGKILWMAVTVNRIAVSCQCRFYARCTIHIKQHSMGIV